MSFHYGQPEEVGMSSNRLQIVERTAERLLREGISPAQVIAAARRGTMVLHKAYGVSGPEAEAPPLTLESLFPICSITKVFTAACIMMLVEDGLVGLNRPVCDYIPEFTGDGKREIRIHHLLTHTSGLTNESTHEHVERKRALMPGLSDDKRSDADFMQLSYDSPICRPPGQAMAYCGYGFELLGEVISRTSGMTYTEFARTRLFEPLGMDSTYFIVPSSERYRLVRRPSDAPCAEWLANESFLQSESPAGGAISTALDLAKFGQLFLNRGEYNRSRLLGPAAVSEMVKNQIPGISSSYRDEYFPEAYWGYGWSINGDKRDGGDLFSPSAFSHWGAAGPFLCVDPVYETVHVYMNRAQPRQTF
ncbi:beta-lactamase family protein [Paenibacillus sp. sptzw28]|uniref:serine hydrolase domain-containing protein n=1 Tax=Paenibacillus sp. sptzw28 TaxID=715179 RepID=UPI001C6EC6A0|nr:serine hydrolase domain-containing protein [Paenibacillus sp. sptzw28]QYR21446.1 beta-lactamase family protein [Paenibacillus sp. sptzw28]